MDPSRILNKNLPLLIQQLQPDEVLDYLLSEDVLSQAEYDRCRDNNVKSDRIRELIRLLMCKGERGYREFCKVLDRDQRHVKQALDNTARGEGSHDLVYIPETTLVRELGAKEETIRRLQQELQWLKQERETIVNDERRKIGRELDEERQGKIKALRDLKDKVTKNDILSQRIKELEKENKDLQSKSVALPRIEFEEEEQKQSSVPGPFDTMKCALMTSEACVPKRGLVLPCLHSVCETCLQQHTEENLTCFCGREVARKDVTQVDYVRRHEHTRDTNIRCAYRTIPCTNAVVSTCEECKISLCQACMELHNSINPSASHDVHYINRSDNENGDHYTKPMCDHHSSQHAIYIDHQCHKKICGTCFANLHVRHDVSTIEEEYERQKSLLSKVIEDHRKSLENVQACLKERCDRIHALKSNKKKKVQHMANLYENFVQVLKERFEYLRESMIRETKRLQDDIVQDMKSLQETEAAYLMTLDYARRCLNVGELHLIALAPMIAKNAEEDRKRLLPKCTALTKDIVFSPQGNAALLNLIRRFGGIKCTGRHARQQDDLPTLEDLQKQNDALQQKLETLTDECRKQETKTKEEKDLICEAVSLLKDKLEHCGIFIHEPRQLRKTCILQCIHIEFSKDKLNIHKARITTNGDLVNDGKIITLLPGQGRLERYMGTCGTTILPSPGVPGYLEVIAKVCLKTVLTKNDLILEMGMCREKVKDKGHTIGDAPHSYSMAVSHCSNHNRICRIFWKEKRHHLCLPAETIPNNAVASGILRVGIAYDNTRYKIAFIDVEASQVMAVLDGVDFRQPLLPMFGVYNPDRVSVSMRGVKVKEMEISEEKIRLILNALS
ncbi:CAP-Gly domain-containing linker protein 1-like [Haliotis asinina]|uniref:CAP-Gly domain-containing linker protein 1-like n=1 Tax=Haliotis asinina TaxID=109174 RepID=UPI003531FFAC